MRWNYVWCNMELNLKKVAFCMYKTPVALALSEFISSTLSYDAISCLNGCRYDVHTAYWKFHHCTLKKNRPFCIPVPVMKQKFYNCSSQDKFYWLIRLGSCKIAWNTVWVCVCKITWHIFSTLRRLSWLVIQRPHRSPNIFDPLIIRSITRTTWGKPTTYVDRKVHKYLFNLSALTLKDAVIFYK